MEPIDLSFLEFPGVHIKGEIYEPSHPEVLLQDLLEIEMPSGEIIDVSWYPEHDPDGSFRISVYDYSIANLRWCAITQNISEALAITYSLVMEHFASSPSSVTTRGELVLEHVMRGPRWE